MNNENWNPGHSINKGYPYNGIESQRTMKKRPSLSMDEDGKILISWNTDMFPDVADDQTRRTELEDFLLHRLYDFHETLAVAEGQITDLLEEKPFIPENYGFELVHKNPDITQPPVRIYQSIFDERFSLFRKPVKSEGSIHFSIWTLMSKNENGSFTEHDINLPCDRIAYAVLFSLGVRMEKVEGKETDTRHAKEEVMPARGTKSFGVQVHRVDERCCIDISRSIEVEAANASDALSKAKFIFETDHKDSVYLQDILPEELSIIS